MELCRGFELGPMIYLLAKGIGLRGWVRNADVGLEIEIEGRSEQNRSIPA
jgi:hydrogenase maturation factor HypF (carbamoyltransferase family)